MQGYESIREQKQPHFTIALLIAQLFLFLSIILTSRVRFQSSHSLSFSSLTSPHHHHSLQQTQSLRVIRLIYQLLQSHQQPHIRSVSPSRHKGVRFILIADPVIHGSGRLATVCLGSQELSESCFVKLPSSSMSISATTL